VIFELWNTIIIGLLSLVLTLLSSKGQLYDNRRKWYQRLSNRGGAVIIIGLLIVSLSSIQYWKIEKRNSDKDDLIAQLSIRLSEKATDIYDLSKKIKYPLPETAKASLQFYVKLDNETQKEADLVLSKLNLTNDEKHYDLVDYKLVRSFLGLGSIKLHFSKEITLKGNSPWFSREHLHLDGYFSDVTRLNYNSALKIFFVTVENILLSRHEWFDSNLSSNLGSKSILDLENCSVTMEVITFNNTKVSDFKILRIISPELNLTFKDLERWPEIDGNLFICSQKLKLEQ